MRKILKKIAKLEKLEKKIKKVEKMKRRIMEEQRHGEAVVPETNKAPKDSVLIGQPMEVYAPEDSIVDSYPIDA